MLEIPAHTYEHGREKVEGWALMVACAEGGAAVACAEFESGSASKTLSKAALGAVARALNNLRPPTNPPHIVVMCAV